MKLEGGEMNGRPTPRPQPQARAAHKKDKRRHDLNGTASPPPQGVVSPRAIATATPPASVGGTPAGVSGAAPGSVASPPLANVKVEPRGPNASPNSTASTPAPLSHYAAKSETPPPTKRPKPVSTSYFLVSFIFLSLTLPLTAIHCFRLKYYQLGDEADSRLVMQHEK